MADDSVNGPCLGFWFKTLITITLLALIILAGFNAATYNKIANENITVGDVDPAGARALMWINIVFLVICIPLWLWLIWNWVLTLGARTYVTEKAASAYQYTKQGVYSGTQRLQNWGQPYNNGIIDYSVPVAPNVAPGMGEGIEMQSVRSSGMSMASPRGTLGSANRGFGTPMRSSVM
jgi:hypothetical protein